MDCEDIKDVAEVSRQAMSLRECYDGIARLVPNLTLDSFEVVKEVARYRDLWRPRQVSVVLLAESHVYTTPFEFDHDWSFEADITYQGRYVRFVYCLAYGEGRLVDVRSNRGTWQYWKLLFSCLNPISDHQYPVPVLRKYTPEFEERMKSKIALLRMLAEAGVWLVDASIVGIAGKDWTTKSKVLRHCWRTYVGPSLEKLDPKPKHIIVVGDGVSSTLGSEIDRLGIAHSSIKQPNARLPRGYLEYYRHCFETCREFRN